MKMEFVQNAAIKNTNLNKGAVLKVMSVALIELVEMTATLNVVVSINSTTVMQTYWTAPLNFRAKQSSGYTRRGKVNLMRKRYF